MSKSAFSLTLICRQFCIINNHTVLGIKIIRYNSCLCNEYYIYNVCFHAVLITLSSITSTNTISFPVRPHFMSTPQVYTVKHTLFSPNPITWNDAVKGPRKLAIFSVSTAKVTLATLVTNLYFVAARYLKIGISSTRPPSTTGSWPLSTSHYRW